MLYVPPVLPKIAFVIAEDWFFVSHFLPMLRAARHAGLEPIVITRVRDHAGIIEAAGARVIPLEADRRSFNPLGLAATTLKLASILRREKVSAVHCVALRSIAIGGPAALLAGIGRRVFAVTGGGFLSAKKDFSGRAAEAGLRFYMRNLIEGDGTRYLFENTDDPEKFGLETSDERVTIVGGAGVDPDHLAELPMPEVPPLRVAIVARMLWSKGVDVAVEAVQIARAKGYDVRLTLCGEPDQQNPRTISRNVLEHWASLDGIEWRGFVRDVRTVWRDHHVACLASRGGEGLPRTILEAASCGRAIITTDVPGCRHFVKDGVEGLLVKPDDAVALSEALIRLTVNRGEVARMGAAARERIHQGFREQDTVAAVADMYARMFAGFVPTR